MDAVDPARQPTDHELKTARNIAFRAARAAGSADADADDVAQSVLEKLVTRWHSPKLVAVRHRGERAWTAYVAAMGRNAFIDLVRSKERRRAREEKAGDRPASKAPSRPGVQRQQRAQRSDVDLYLARVALLELVYGSGLSRRQESVVILHFVEGLTSAEIAEHLDITAQTARKHLRLAIGKLAKHLKDEAASDHHSGEPAG